MSVFKRKFTRDFKLQVVSEIENGIKTRAQVTREYELSEGLLGKWVTTVRKEGSLAFVGNNHPSSDLEKLQGRISQLEGALGRKTMEVEILKSTLEALKIKKGAFTKS